MAFTKNLDFHQERDYSFRMVHLNSQQSIIYFKKKYYDIYYFKTAE